MGSETFCTKKKIFWKKSWIHQKW